MPVNIGVLWDYEIDHSSSEPIKKKELIDNYAEFSELAESKNATIYLANYRMYENGVLKQALKWDDGDWQPQENIELDVIFDKFVFNEETREIKKEMHEKLPMLNAFELEEVCKDKLLTYRKFPDHVPETDNATRENVNRFLEEDGKAIIKPRFGSEGMEVKLIDSIKDFEEKEDLLVQRYVDPSGGTPHFDFDGAHDFRVVVVNGEPEMCYYRLNEGDLANVSMGGSRKFVEVEEIPGSVLEIIEAVDKKFQKYEPALYSVDVMFDSSMKPFIIELSSKPGLTVDDDDSRKYKLPVKEKLVEILVQMSQS